MKKVKNILKLMFFGRRKKKEKGEGREVPNGAQDIPKLRKFPINLVKIKPQCPTRWTGRT
jgi:hypothetical protein